MRVGIDGRAFTSPAGGIRRYVTKLIVAARAFEPDVVFVALGGDPDALPSGMPYIAEPHHPPTNAGWAIVGLPRAAARGRVDLIHAPSYTGPLWSGVPVVLTVHDVSYARRPEWYPYQLGAARRWFYRQSARRATHLLTDSAFSAAEIMAAYAIRRERITVVPLGVDTFFTPADPGIPTDVPAGIAGPYLLHAGDLHPRRNLAMMVDALAGARRHAGAASGLSLVLAGVDRGVGEALRAAADEKGLGGALVCLGPVSDERLRALYRGAAAFVYPSRYEGFGLPPLEAMACGAPVIASRAASIPEVVGNAAVLLDPDDLAGWERTIVEVVNDEARRARLRADGVARAAAFTWARTARLTLDAYRQVLAA